MFKSLSYVKQKQKLTLTKMWINLWICPKSILNYIMSQFSVPLSCKIWSIVLYKIPDTWATRLNTTLNYLWYAKVNHIIDIIFIFSFCSLFAVFVYTFRSQKTGCFYLFRVSTIIFNISKIYNINKIILNLFKLSFSYYVYFLSLGKMKFYILCLFRSRWKFLSNRMINAKVSQLTMSTN